MTHTVAADAYRRLVQDALPGIPTGVHVALVLVEIGLVGAAFYVAIERPSLWLRRRLAPRRSDVPSPALMPSA